MPPRFSIGCRLNVKLDFQPFQISVRGPQAVYKNEDGFLNYWRRFADGWFMFGILLFLYSLYGYMTACFPAFGVASEARGLKFGVIHAEQRLGKERVDRPTLAPPHGMSNLAPVDITLHCSDEMSKGSHERHT